MYAYHPYTDNTTDEYLFTVNTNQTTNINVYNSDLLYCTEFAQVDTQSLVKIKLDQKLSHVLSDLTSGDNTPDLTDAKVTLLNVKTSVIFNRKTGAVSNPTNQKDVKLNKGGSGGIIIPQKIAVGTKFAKICLKDGKEMFYTKTTSLTQAKIKNTL